MVVVIQAAFLYSRWLLPLLSSLPLKKNVGYNFQLYGSNCNKHSQGIDKKNSSCAIDILTFQSCHCGRHFSNVKGCCITRIVGNSCNLSIPKASSSYLPSLNKDKMVLLENQLVQVGQTHNKTCMAKNEQITIKRFSIFRMQQFVVDLKVA